MLYILKQNAESLYLKHYWIFSNSVVLQISFEMSVRGLEVHCRTSAPPILAHINSVYMPETTVSCFTAGVFIFCKDSLTLNKQSVYDQGCVLTEV